MRKIAVVSIAVFLILLATFTFAVDPPAPPSSDMTKINSRLEELDKKVLVIIQRQTEMDLNMARQDDVNKFAEQIKKDFTDVDARINTRADAGIVIIIMVLISAVNWVIVGFLKGSGRL